MPEHLKNEQLLTSLSEEKLGPVLQSLGRVYLRVAGFTQNKVDEIFSSFGTHEFWDAKYIDETGKHWGMDTMDALRCLIDTHRTSILLSSIRNTVEDVKAKRSGPIVAIDAGTGTGILSVGLIAAGCDKVIALEINENTAKVTKDFLKVLGLSNKIEVVTCDATKVELPSVKGDILVSENLSCGLFDEPQYQIINHLSKFLKPNAEILPHKAEISVSLGYSSWKDAVLDKEKFTLDAWKLSDLQLITPKYPYTEIDSKVGMDIPIIKGSANLFIGWPQVPVNTVIISTKFEVGHGKNTQVLEPDSAEFLGKSAALRLPEEPLVKDGMVIIDLNYPVGMPIKYSQFSVTDNRISLYPQKDWGKN